MQKRFEYFNNELKMDYPLKEELNLANLGSWLRSWVQPNGAIYGFHNHSVWGGNPYRWNDFTSGHTTWASPLLVALSLALSKEMNTEGLKLLRSMIKFQTSSFLDDGQYAHIGFQVGETLQWGLIHNAMPNVALGLTALIGKTFLPEEDLQCIKKSIIKNVEGCNIYGDGRANEGSCCNQDYARIWAKILFQISFQDYRWEKEIFEDIDYLLAHFHVKGIPDMECEATTRSLNNKDSNIVEPGEYYGLIISPLVLAYELTNNKKYLEHAGALSRHIVRSSWKDENGQIRFHRLWMRKSSNSNKWIKQNKPMLVAGMGITLYGIENYLNHVEDEELNKFLGDCDRTYAYYQTQRGYFVSASGWQSEVDIAPCSAWHTHDFFYLINRHGIKKDFWGEFFKPNNKTSVLLGEQCIWIENDINWAITDYMFQDVFSLLGRKDENIFGRDYGWVPTDRKLPNHFDYSDKPTFVKTEDGIYLSNRTVKSMEIYCAANVPFKGEL